MKRISRGIASILSIPVAFSAMVPVVGNAFYGGEEYVEKYVNGGILVEDDVLAERFFNTIKDLNYYGKETRFYIDARQRTIYIVTDAKDYISFSVGGDFTNEEVEAYINQICPEWYIVSGAHDEEGNGHFSIGYQEFRNVSEPQAREMFSALDKEFELRSFDYHKDQYYIYYGAGITRYQGDYIREIILQYVTDNGLDWQVRYSVAPETGEPATNSYVYIDPAEGDNVSEYLNILLSLNTEGIYCDMDFPDSATDYISVDIDILNSVTGDSNCDGEMNMADAVLIMQSVTNPDKYGIGKENGITAQGAFNADVYNSGSGITNSDALAIQQRLLNSESQ